jgi:glyoxylase-like metal-dependent hydrolase (beta-lactamase superfamily II)
VSTPVDPASAPRPRKQEQETAQVEVTEVASGILRMQLPIHLTGLGHVNCYALEDQRGWTIVDPGLPGPKTMKALKQRLGQAGARLKDVHTVVVTHSHPDHFGTAGLIRERYGAQVVAHERFRTWFDPEEADDIAVAADAEHAPRAAKDRPKRASSEQIRERMTRPTPWGGRPPVPQLKGLKGRMIKLASRRYLKTPAPSVRLEDAEHVTLGGREWVALYTPGHTEDHLCLYDPSDGVVLSGDHVLPTITPHISGLGDVDDSLADYVSSLDRMASLPDVSVVLPAHGHPFDDLPGRVKDIKRHHDERLDVLREANQRLGPATVTDLSHEMFRERSWGPMAESETYAHLEHLRLRGEATAEPGDDGFLYFHLT